MSEPRGRLTPLQAEILDSFFALESRFYLTGGGALAGFHLGHREIFANKLCALLGRSEIRDLVAVRALEESGLSLTDGLAGGQRKDGGLTPGQLAFVLSEIQIADDASLPGGVHPAGLRDYLRGLIDRLTRLAHP
jgi:hypothetical protein